MTEELLAQVDDERLARFIGQVAPLDGPLEVRVLSGGRSNVTYVARSGGHEYVVRRRPVGHVPAGAHDMAREHRVLAALRGSAVPVPTVFEYCDDEAIVGAPFYVMSLVPGVVFHRRDDVATLSAAQAGQISTDLVDVLDRLHRVDPVEVGLGQLGRPEGFVARRITRWLEQWLRGLRRDHAMVETLGARLAAAVPEHTDATIVHGDYRLGNVLITSDDPRRVVAVLDWELSTLGDPLTDLAHLLVYWEPTCGRVTHESQAISAHPGFHRGADLAARYGELSGRSVEGLDFYLAFEHWRAAIIKEAIFQRRTASGEDDGDANELGDSVERHLEEAGDLLATVRSP